MHDGLFKLSDITTIRPHFNCKSKLAIDKSTVGPISCSKVCLYAYAYISDAWCCVAVPGKGVTSVTVAAFR